MECEPQAQRGDAAAGFEGARKVLCAFIPDMVVCQIEVSELAMRRECPREVHDATSCRHRLVPSTRLEYQGRQGAI